MCFVGLCVLELPYALPLACSFSEVPTLMARGVGLVVLVGMWMFKPRSTSEVDRVRELTTVPSLVKHSHVNLLML